MTVICLLCCNPTFFITSRWNVSEESCIFAASALSALRLNETLRLGLKLLLTRILSHQRILCHASCHPYPQNAVHFISSNKNLETSEIEVYGIPVYQMELLEQLM